MAIMLLLLLGLFLALHFIKANKNRGPLALPLIGHLHLLDGSAAHRSLLHLSQIYGPLMLLQFGALPTLVVSDAHSAQQVLHIHGTNFLSRPAFAVAEHHSYHYQSLAMSPYGPQWKKLRRICSTLLLHRSRLDSSNALRMEMVRVMIDSVTHAAVENSILDLRSLLSETMFNIMTMMLMSKRYFGSGIADESKALQFTTVQTEKVKLGGSFYAGDFLPFLRFLKRFDRNLRALEQLHNSQDAFLQEILDERRAQNKGLDSDFLDLLLSIARDEELTDDVIKAFIQDLIDGGTETTKTTIEWAVAELIRHPNTMKDLKQELGKVVGQRSLNEADLSSLPYLECVIKETLRLHPPLPSLIPRQCDESCIIEGLTIPKNAMLIINFFAIGRDPTYWEHPLEFIPQRFVHNNLGPKFIYVPFGGGRRSCPGELLGMTMVKVVLGSLIHQFDWRLENGLGSDVLDMSEDLGAFLRIKNPLKLIPSLASNI